MIKLPRLFSVSYSGQATLLAILIATAVAIVTAVGVTSRQNSSFRRTTYTTQTDQSFSCANSAVDAALLCITEKEKAGLPGTSCVETDTVVGPATGENTCKYSYTVAQLNDSTIKLDPLLKGNVQQLDTTNVSSLNIKWKVAGSGSQPAMEMTYAYLESGVPKMKKFAYTCNGVPTGVSVSPGFSGASWSGGFCNVTLNSGSGLKTGGISSILRIKPLFADAYVEVSNFNGATPVQGLKINAKGTAGNVVRNIVVSRMNPQLPALFDYVLYSEEGNIQK